MIQKNWLRILLAVFAGMALSVVLHQVYEDPLMDENIFIPSVLITSGWFIPVAVVSLFIVYSFIGLIFLNFHKHIPGKKIPKSIVFGVAYGGLWIIGMVEVTVLFGTPFFREIYTGLADALGILLMCVLLAKYVTDDTLEGKGNGQYVAKHLFPALAIIPIIYIVVRYFAYTFLNIHSAYDTNQLATFLWTAVTGIWIGIMYWLMGMDTWHTQPLIKAGAFGGLIFGLIWIPYQLFALLFSTTFPVSDFVTRASFDTLAVIVGVYIVAVLEQRHTANHSHLADISN